MARLIHSDTYVLTLPVLSLLALCMLTTNSPALAQDDIYKPDKNPFGQPDILKYRPPIKSPKKNSVRVDKFNVPELKLTATLISVSEPMVIVNGQLLQPGEKIEGMKLIVIDEGRAVFQFRGRKHVFTIDDGQNAQPR